MKHRILSLLLVLLVLNLAVTGCWSRRELEKLSFVSALAFDRTDNNKIRLTVQLVQIRSLKSSGGESGQGKAYYVMSSTGDTVFEAVRNFMTQSGRKLYFQHMMIIVLGGGLARDGILPALDFLLRDHEIRPLTRVLVTGGEASAIVDADSKPESVPAQHLNFMLEGYGAVSKTVDVNLYELYNCINQFEPSRQAVVGRVELSGSGSDMPKRLVVSGAGVFHGDKLTGWLDPQETRGYLWIRGEVKSGIITVASPQNENRRVSLEIIKAGSKIKPSLEDGEMRYTIQVSVESNVGEVMGSASITPDTFDQLEQEQANAVKEEIEGAIKEAQKSDKTDIIGLGEITRRKFPNRWKNMQGEWEQIFPDSTIQVVVQSKIRNTGLSS